MVLLLLLLPVGAPLRGPLTPGPVRRRRLVVQRVVLLLLLLQHLVVFVGASSSSSITFRMEVRVVRQHAWNKNNMRT